MVSLVIGNAAGLRSCWKIPSFDVSNSLSRIVLFRREFETYGTIKSIRIVQNVKDGKPRG